MRGLGEAICDKHDNNNNQTTQSRTIYEMKRKKENLTKFKQKKREKEESRE